MLVKIIGVQAQNYRLDNGYSFKGNKIHAEDLETIPDGMIGHMVLDFKIADGHPLASVPLSVGEIYRVYFNQKGALDFIMKDNNDGKGGAK